jgi:uncharacterized protein YbjT (DUF2867 family)
MTRILITGGTGYLGSRIAARLNPRMQTIRIMSRSPRPSTVDPSIEWAQADLATGKGIVEAVHDTQVIVHAATNSSMPLKKGWRETDILGTQRLVETARQAGVNHLLYISIVGVDRIPFSYYKVKVEVEQIVRESGVPYTISRATQFHSFIDRIFAALNRISLLLPVPSDFLDQPMDGGDYADYLLPYITGTPAGRIPDAAGPQVMRADEMARMWLHAQGLRKPLVKLPLFGAAAEGFRQGYHTAPDRAVGAITWEAWLAQKYGVVQGHSTMEQPA